MKRLIVCCDGTWQSQDNSCHTNVFKIAQAVKPIAKDKRGQDIPQVLYYDEGIGAVPRKKIDIKEKDIQKIADKIRDFTFLLPQIIKDFIEKLGGGAFGWWINDKIREAYIFLCLNYLPGDEIYLFGFSRGAYTVRSLAGLIDCCGLLKRPDIAKVRQVNDIYRLQDELQRNQEAEDFRRKNATQQVEIKLLGCWDTVGALGIPDLIPWLPIDRWINQKYTFHNTKLSSIIQNARHAIAIDEKRKAFDVNIMKSGTEFEGTLKQVWFPGDHGCVGGGNENTLGLSNAALKWMAEQASQLGLDLDLNLAKDTKKEETGKIDYTTKFVNRSMLRLIGEQERDLKKLNEELKPNFPFDPDKSFHPSVKERWCNPKMNYRPQKLEEFLALHGGSDVWERVAESKNYQPVN